MKKIITLTAILGFALASHAASVAWSTVKLSFGETSLKNSSVNAYLVYLESGSLSDSYTFTESFSAASIGKVVQSTDSVGKTAKAMGTFQFPSGTYNNGDSFGLLLSYTDSGKTYWNLSSVVNTLSGLDPDDTTVAPADWNDFTAGSTVSESKTLSKGGGWVAAVPEPSTAMLALAGLALLIKRRRA